MFWKNFKISQKLFIGFGIVTFIMLSVIGYSYVSFEEEDKALEASLRAYEVIGYTDDILINILNMETGARGYGITGQDEFLMPYDQGKLNYERDFDSIKTLTIGNTKQQERLIQVNNSYGKWLKWSEENLILGRKKVAKGEGRMDDFVFVIQKGEGKKEMDMIRSIIDEIIEEEQGELTLINERLNKLKTQTAWVMSVGGTIAAVLAILIALLITQIIVTPVKALTDTFKDISEGEADFEFRLMVDSKDELGQMANHFNIFMNKIKAMSIENNNETWIKTGEAELNEEVRGAGDVKELAAKAITYIVKHTNSQIGAMYVRSNGDTLKLLGSYAYKKRKNLSNEIKIGEGLVGQAALERQTIIITQVPDDYIRISSGLGETVPTNILVAPCIYEDEVKCVIEIGSLASFTDSQLEFIERISQHIAVIIHSIESRIKTQELLDTTLEQAKVLKDSEATLQAQQEELRQSNEELEEQASALLESESRLQAQQEELRVINEELEEHTKSLELQKSDILIKNENLKNAQIEIEEKAKAIETTSKYKSEFLANMSHELRTPLNSILVLSQMLGEKKPNNMLTDKQLEYANTINSSGKDLLKLINDVLDLSKVEAGKLDVTLEPINLIQLSNTIESSFKHIAKQKGVDFKVIIDQGIPEHIISDAQRVQQIINNLLSNALKFTDKGEVTLRIHHPKKDDHLGDQGTLEQSICISVKDTGIGIPKEKQAIIFEAFKQSDGTTSRKYGGTGLGLSISRELANLLGGEIYLASEEDNGSTFTLVLPEKSKDLSVASKPALPKEKENTVITAIINDDRNNIAETDKSLLIIEDDHNFSKVLYDLAHDKGYKALIAEDGLTGIELAKTYRPDAILLDIGLPDMSGWKVIEKLQKDKDTKDTPVHVISGREESTINKNVIVSYIQKPVSLEKLNEVFGGIEEITSKEFKKLLILDQNKEDNQNISSLLGSKDIHVTCLDSGEQAYTVLKNEAFDCMILDLELSDMMSIDFLKRLQDKNMANIPIIIHTEKILTQEEELELQKYTQSIVIKGARSPQRLIAEANLFLHNIGAKIEQDKIKVIKSNQEKEKSLNNKKILVVDDDMRNVFALSSLLEDKGMKVVIGRNGQEGIEKLKENPDIDLILMDIMMPVMDGYAAMSEIRSKLNLRDIPIIALTAKAMKDDRQKCIEAGASDYLTKPLDVEKLISLLRVWLYK